MLITRVSSGPQARNDNLTDQEDQLREEIEKMGCRVAYVWPGHVGSGQHPEWLFEPARCCRKHGFAMVAVSMDRIVRHPDYRSDSNPNARARERDLDRCEGVLLGVPLYVIVEPNAPLRDVRSHATRRGMGAKGNMGGRKPKKVPGYKRQRRIDLELSVLRMHAEGMSLREIVRQTGVPYATIHRWVTEG